MKNLRKWPILVFLLHLLDLGAVGTVGATVCEKKLSDYSTLRGYKLLDSAICAEVFFRASKSAYILSDFHLVPPMKNLRIWLILVFLLNLLEVCAAGTIGAAVCAKNLSDDCHLSAC